MRSVYDFNFQNKRVLLRVDFNEPLKNGEVVNDFKIQASLPTIRYLLDQKAKIILISHLGRPPVGLSGDEHCNLPKSIFEKFSLKPIARHLSGLLGQEVKFIENCLGREVEAEVFNLHSGQIILLENLRFNLGEKNNDVEFTKKLAGLGELYINDAFADAHREHASIVGLPKYLPCCAGLLLEREVDMLTSVLENIQHPLLLIIGGVKVATKVKFIKSFFSKTDEIILGGALANTIISAQGLAIGSSIIDEGMAEEVEKLELTSAKFHLPVDVVVSVDRTGKASSRIAPIGDIEEREMILDIGPDTEELFSRVIHQAKTIIWNGPMGFFESVKFASGTKKVAMDISQCGAFTVAGGGETIACLSQLGLLEKINHISTGGGAMLKFLTAEKMPGIEALK